MDLVLDLVRAQMFHGLAGLARFSQPDRHPPVVGIGLRRAGCRVILLSHCGTVPHVGQGSRRASGAAH
jgi:hypothetical protein